MKKTKIIIIVSSCIILLILLFFSIFNFTKVDVYKEGSKIKFYKKVKNEHTHLNFFKPNPEKYLEIEDLIIYKNPKNFDADFSEKQNYCARLIAKPGDKLHIGDTKVYVNNKTLNENYDLYFLYRITMPDSVNFKELLNDYNVEIVEILAENKACNFIATQEQADEVAKIKDAVNIRKIYLPLGRFIYGVFPAEAQIAWNPDNFGPIIIPQKGTTISLHRKNMPLYRYIIEVYEGNELFHNYAKTVINGKTVTEYTFRKNYYFIMNDNRYDYQDSRGWGFIPEDQILGKVL
ncbi:MAG: S26 family signal peptidase [Bacteroidales bacterium]|jgi:signal peptidase I|nr:S26 family signal peptidase [Bacteroidales bacterium]